MPKKEKIAQMFDSIAPQYDAFNHIASLGIDRMWRRAALRHIDGPQVLDVACGTGDFAITIARKRHCAVTGVDISEKMLEVMRRKVEEERLEKSVTAESGDCASLRFRESSFDNVTVAFGVRNFEDRAACLREIYRVLRPGGKFVMLELGVPSIRIIRRIYEWYFTKITPMLGRRMSGNAEAYRYLPASVLAFPGKKEWMAAMREAGFCEVRHRALTFGICRMYIGTK